VDQWSSQRGPARADFDEVVAAARVDRIDDLRNVVRVDEKILAEAAPRHVSRHRVTPPRLAAARFSAQAPRGWGRASWGGPAALGNLPPAVASRPPPQGGRAPWGGPAALGNLPPAVASRPPPQGGRAPWGGPAALGN